MIQTVHVDVIGTPEIVEARLAALNNRLAAIAAGNEAADLSEESERLDLAPAAVRNLKVNDMRGMLVRFAIADFMHDYKAEYGTLAADAIAGLLEGVDYHREGERRIVELPDEVIVYSEAGVIRKASERGYRSTRFTGQNAFHYLATRTEQDLALVLCQDGKLVYAADISRFEKATKDQYMGRNRLLGQDLLTLQGASRLIPALLENLVAAMTSDNLDHLTLDMQGRRVYSYRGEKVQRFERDTFVPLRDRNGLQGILAYADVQFQPLGMIGYKAGNGLRPYSQAELQVLSQ